MQFRTIGGHFSKGLSVAAAFFLLGAMALAAPGDLDTSFAGAGFIRVGFDLGDDLANGIARQTDGKIVVVGGSDFSVVRYNSDGSLDPSFGNDGKVTTTVGGGKSAATAVRVQGDGRIVVAGYTEFDFPNPASVAVVRYDVDGSLDPSFGTGGKVTYGFDGVVFRGNALVIQGDNKLVVAGSITSFGGKTDFAVFRFNSDGSVDTSFGPGGPGDFPGVAQTTIGSGYDSANAVTILNDMIIAAGSTINADGNADFAVLRYTSTGLLDSFFDGDGIVTTPVQFGTSEDIATAIAIQFGNNTVFQPDKILVVGSSSGVTNNDFALVRYNLDGSLDTTFDTDGKVTTPIGTGSDIAKAVLIQEGGLGVPLKIMVAGSSDAALSKTNFALARYQVDGSLDPTFDQDGILTTQIDSNKNVVAGMIAQADGKLVVAGSIVNLSSNFLNDFAVVRYNPDGSLDASFDQDGKRIDNVGDRGGTGEAVALQEDGKIVVAGTSSNGFAVFRSNPDGSADTTFSGDGKVTTVIESFDYGKAVAVQADNKIVVAGLSYSSVTSTYSIAVARYDANGALDLSFNGTGIVTTILDFYSDAIALALQDDGKIVVVASVGDFVNPDIALFRYLPEGGLDPSFDGDGIRVIPITGVQEARAVALQSDGKIVVAGTDRGAFSLVRCNSDGTLDLSFDGDGIVTTAIDSGTNMGQALALQSDGKIVVCGSAGTGDLAIARYNPNGTLDPSFNGIGKLIDPEIQNGTAVAVQRNGKIVVTSGFLSGGTMFDFIVARYKSDGTRDVSYGENGIATVDLSGGGSDIPVAVALDASGRAVAAGSSVRSFGITRLEGDPTPTILGNISTRLRVETGDHVLIGGFIVTGTQPKKVIVRALGPSLPLTGTLANPTVELFGPSGSITSNDDWMDAANKQEIIDTGLAPGNDRESAIVATLPSNSTAYTAIVRGVNETSGVGLVEVYDLDAGTDSQLANISTRGFVQTGDNVMIGGFIVLGTDPEEVIVRAIGPSLTALGVAGALADPTLELIDGNGGLVMANDNWRDNQETEISATGLAPTDDAEAAIVQTLPAGAAYTAIVRGTSATTGIALVEVYALGP